MRATCVIERKTGQIDDGRGGVTTVWEQVYPDHSWPADHPDAAGPCYTRYPGLANESTFDSAGASVVQSKLVLRVPFGVAFRPGDRATILADIDNPQMAGTVLRVASIDDMSQATAQRLLCEDNQAGV